MRFEDAFGISTDEFCDIMSQAVTADLCLRDMGRLVDHGNFVHRGNLCYKAGFALLDSRDLLGNLWRERKPLYLYLYGARVGNVVFPHNALPEIESHFDADVFRREMEEFVDICIGEAMRIDGVRGVSYIEYGLYCLNALKNEQERLLSWERFAQV